MFCASIRPITLCFSGFCDASQDNVAVQAFCYRWVTPEELEAPEPAQGEDSTPL